MNPIVTIPKRCAFILFAVGALFATAKASAEQLGLQQIWVGHELVECPSDPVRLCYLVKQEQYDEWGAFEGSIGNFHYREGVAYLLLVEIELSASGVDRPGTRYRVVQILEEFETFDEPETPSRIASSAEESIESTDLPDPAISPAPSPVESTAAAPPPSPEPSPVEEVAAVPSPSPEPTPVQKATVAPAPTPVEKVAEAPPPPTPAPSAPPAPGERHRGILTIGSGMEARSFTPCGEEVGIWIEDESGASLWKVYRERVAAPNHPLMIEIRGELSPAPTSGFGAHYDRQLTVMEVLRVDESNTDCTWWPAEVVAAEPAEVVTTKAAEVVATRPAEVVSPTTEPIEVLISGGPPSWRLSIGPGGIVFSGPSAPESIRFPYASPERSSSGATYVTAVEGPPPHALKVVIDREPCPDTETGVRRDFTAYLTLDGRWLRGCVSEGHPVSDR